VGLVRRGGGRGRGGEVRADVEVFGGGDGGEGHGWFLGGGIGVDGGGLEDWVFWELGR